MKKEQSTKQKVIAFLKSKDIAYEDGGDFLATKEGAVRIYPVSNTYDFRTPYYDDVGGVPKDYFMKTSIANEEAGIRTIWVKPWEFIEGSRHRNVLESIISTASGKIDTVFNGRDCEVRELAQGELRPFLEENSFYGYRSASLSLGLYLKKDVGEFPKGTLLMLYTFGHPFFGGKKKKYDLEVIRAATRKNCQVRGGASKLIKHFITNYPVVVVGGKENAWETLCYYVDYDHNSGNSLPHLGFEFDKYAGPGFMNVNVETGAVTHREPKRHKEIMQLIREKKMFSIFNAGVKVFTYKKGTATKNNSEFIAE